MSSRPALTCLIVPNSVWVPGVMVGTVIPEVPPCPCPPAGAEFPVDAELPAGAADAPDCRPVSETAAAPVPRPTALLKVRLLIMRSLPSCDSGEPDPRLDDLCTACVT